MSDSRPIAYFSMEVSLEAGIPTYSGGLGVLSGDTLRAAADLQIPMVAVTLLYRKGYFLQRLDPHDWQQEEPAEWDVEKFLKAMPQRTSVTIAGSEVSLRVWRYEVKGIRGDVIPVYLLDADCPENSTQQRALTHFLYGGDQKYRLSQEIILGIGGIRMLRALGLEEIRCFHINEGHASLLTLELLDEQLRRNGRSSLTKEDLEKVRDRCVFTTHTPIPAGHDKFSLELVRELLGPHRLFEDKELFPMDGTLNTTELALRLSRFANGVSRKHGEVSRQIFPGYPIQAITNGVHAVTWVAAPFRELFDRYLSDWKEDNFNLRNAMKISGPEVWAAHQAAKGVLLEQVARRAHIEMELNVLTLGFARRFVAYKRPGLLFHDLDQLKRLANEVGPLQILYTGKAHPNDEAGKAILQRIVQIGRQLHDPIRFAYLENYDMELGKMICSGVDLWLNTPQIPLEASGTSGMKAALNGVPSLSIRDGWWEEGHVEGVTGWSFAAEGEIHKEENREEKDAAALYKKLREVALIYYRHPSQFAEVMKHAIALNGSFFNTQRMMREYVLEAYLH